MYVRNSRSAHERLQVADLKQSDKPENGPEKPHSRLLYVEAWLIGVISILTLASAFRGLFDS